MDPPLWSLQERGLPPSFAIKQENSAPENEGGMDKITFKKGQDLKGK
jgi:hypothetical protein